MSSGYILGIRKIFPLPFMVVGLRDEAQKSQWPRLANFGNLSRAGTWQGLLRSRLFGIGRAHLGIDLDSFLQRNGADRLPSSVSIYYSGSAFAEKVCVRGEGLDASQGIGNSLDAVGARAAVGGASMHSRARMRCLDFGSL